MEVGYGDLDLGNEMQDLEIEHGDSDSGGKFENDDAFGGLDDFFGIKRLRSDKHSYVSIGLLGQGGFSDVMVARQEDTGKVVAIKRVFQPFPVRGAPSQELSTRYPELLALISVQHDNVIGLVDHIPDEQSPALVLEMCASDLWAMIDAALSR
eukprot:jgi/Botrbrau1/16025/Bobra.0268s0007.1